MLSGEATTKKRKSDPGPYLRYLELIRDRITDASHSPYALPAFRNLETLSFHPKVTGRTLETIDSHLFGPCEGGLE